MSKLQLIFNVYTFERKVTPANMAAMSARWLAGLL